MIEFRTFGAIEVARSDGVISPPMDSRSKMVGLLAYLTLEGHQGVVRREKLCYLFWPESDEQHGRNSLSQTLHGLRSSLGSGLIIGGRNTVGLDPDMIRCDAVEFLHALSRDDWQAALDLYRGEFLSALHIGGAPDFQRWLDAQQASLRQKAFSAAQRLAQSRESTGDYRGTVAALRRARAIQPGDDETVRALIAVHFKLGNADDAVVEFEGYRTYLRNEFGFDPPEESVALYEDLVSRHVRVASDLEVSGESAEPRNLDSLPNQAVVDLPEQGDQARRHFTQLAPLAVVLAGMLMIFPMLTGTFSQPDEPQLDTYRIAVLPVRVSSDADRRAAVTLARGIDGWADLKQVEPSRLEAAVATSNAEILGPDEAERIARRAGAGRFVLVRSEQRDGKLGVRAELHASGEAKGMTALVDTAGPPTEFSDEWHRDVLLSLFRGQAVGLAPGLRSADWIAKPRAMFPYYTALAHESRGELDSALSYLTEAVGIDSTFGAAWDLMAALAVKAEPIATNDWDRRNRYRTIRDTALIYSARYYSEDNSSPAGLEHAKRLAKLFPDSVPLQWKVGLMNWNLSIEQGFDPDSARPYMERAAELDSLQDVSRLIKFHLIRGRLREVRRLVDRSHRNGISIERPDFFETFLDIIEAKTDRQRDSVLVASTQKKDPPGAYALWRTILIQDSMSIPRRVVEVLLPSETQNTVNPYMRLVELSAGRGGALGALAVEPDKSRWWWESRLYGNVPGVLDEPAEVVGALRDTLGAVSYDNWMQELVKRWLLGLLSVRLGDLDAAEDHARAFEQLAADSIPADADSFFVRMAHDFPLEIRAAARAASGDPQTALRLIEDVHFGAHAPPRPEDTLGQPAHYGSLNRKRPFARLLRANLLFNLGRYEEADGWYATFPGFMAPWEDVAFVAPAHRGRARSLDALGRYEEALHYYRRFVTRWQDADPHLQPQVREARQRIAELEVKLANQPGTPGDRRN